MCASGTGIEEVTEPTDWCAPVVPVLKNNGKVRICVDLKKLNEAVKRERFMLPTLEDVAPKLSGAKVFSTLDAANGFYQLPLDEDSSKLTTFITPMGRFCFRRLPFGITSAPDIFQKKMTDILDNQDGAEACMDDILIFGTTIEEHDRHLNQVLEKVKKSGLQLNKDKCCFRQSEIQYYGHIISGDGVHVNPEKVRAIRDLAAPTNLTELRRISGMINYLGRFLPDLSTVMKPMTDLLKASSAWYWGPQQEDSFSKVKDMLMSTPALAFFDPAKPTIVSADASSYGIGAALFQDHEGQLKPVAFCSRTLTSGEVKYAQIEKECLASVWACEHFSRYLIGLEMFTLLTDHKPLVPLINTQDLDKVPVRCQRLLMRLRRFSAKAEYVPGKHLIVPDTLSRSPLKIDEVSTIEKDVELFVNQIESTRSVSDAKIQKIKEESLKDRDLQAAMSYTKNGWPAHRNAVTEPVKGYFDARSELSVSNDLLLYRDRIVIPVSLRSEIIETIHEGHQGVSKCLDHAKMTVWWPGISRLIKENVSACEFCQIHRSSHHKEPLRPTSLPLHPWQKISADLFQAKQQHFLVVMDYYSRYLEIAYLPDISSATVIGKMKNMFARWGVPEDIVSDNGTQFTSAAFQSFAQKYNFVCSFTSPHFPQANGQAEIAVKIAKRIVEQQDPFLGLMAYRSTPISATGVSPAQLMMGRQMRTNLPVLQKKLRPKWPNRQAVKKADEKAKSKYRFYFDRKHQVHSLSDLKSGDTVRIKLQADKNWSTTTASVKKADTYRRSYIVETPQGVFRRNRRHLQLVTPSHDQSNPSLRISDQPAQHDSLQKETKSDAPVIESSIPTELTVPTTESNKNPDQPSTPVKTSSGRLVCRPLKFKDFVC